MVISDFAIKRPIITVVSMLALVIFGIFALMRLQTDEFPDVAPPVVTVGLIYPGASPDGVEREVLDPVEEAISSISGVKKVWGKAEDGFGSVIIEFEFTKPLAEATQDIRDAISGIRADLPTELEEPIIRKFNDTDLPIVSMALSSTSLTPAELTRLADPGITRLLRSIPGVAEVQVSGNVERELTVQIKPEALAVGGRGRVAGRAGARAPESRGAGRPRDRTARGALDPAQGPPRIASRVRAARRRRTQRPAHPARPGRRRVRRHRRAAHGRRLQRARSGRHRRQEVEGLQHDHGERRDPRAHRRPEADAAGGHDDRRREKQRQ